MKSYKINEVEFQISPNLYQYENITRVLSEMNIDLEVLKRLIDGSHEVQESEIINYILEIISKLLSSGKLRELMSWVLTPIDSKFSDETQKQNLESLKAIEIDIVKEIITDFFSSTLFSVTKLFQDLSGYMQKN